jgi:hypothetical protein
MLWLVKFFYVSAKNAPINIPHPKPAIASQMNMQVRVESLVSGSLW